MMLGEESTSADYWKECGDEALARNIKGVIIMVCPTKPQPTTYRTMKRTDRIQLTYTGRPLGYP